MNPELNLSEIAEHAGVAASTVHGWVEREGLPSRKSGRNRLVKLPDLLKFLAHRDGYAPGSQRERLASAQAEKVEMENARRSGELILVSVVGELLNGMAADISSRLEALPGRLANDLAGIKAPAEIRARLLRETRGIRDGVAGYLAKLGE